MTVCLFRCFMVARCRAKHFSYASAGHEPALHYSAKNDQFFTLEAKGLLLGVLSETNYTFHEIVLEENDLIIMMTDGVTEFRVKEELNSREVITTLIKENRHLSAQQLCQLLYKEIERVQNFKLFDDFTVVILKNRFKFKLNRVEKIV